MILAKRHARAAIGALAAVLGASGCFYDSRWLQQKQAQQSALAHARPAELRATPAAPPGEEEIPAKKAARVLKVRAHATARHAAEVVDWPRQLAQTLEAAGEVLGPTLGIRLEIAEATPWTPRGAEEDLEGRLDERPGTLPSRCSPPTPGTSPCRSCGARSRRP
jgi:hypothetical protein